jgi:site-specific DNA-methyltransferase (adenine-specific)
MYQRNVPQNGDALALLQSLPDCCTRLVFFDPQHRENLDRMKYGNEGARQQERCLMPQMTSEYIDDCCRAAARILSPSGYLLRWAIAFQVCEGQHLRLADVLQCVDLTLPDPCGAVGGTAAAFGAAGFRELLFDLRYAGPQCGE